jgi:hypothetical protein
MATTTTLPDEVLELIIRFTSGIPDLTLRIESPKTTTTLTLKLLIRERLPSDDADKRLRLIFSGKILEDATSLNQSLNLKDGRPPSPPPARSAKAEGKQPAREDGMSAAIVRRKYIHCSIGDTLSRSDLQEEAEKAEESKQALLKSLGAANGGSAASTSTASRSQGVQQTGQAPVGFDRLLQTGFSAADVATLRASFLAHLSNTHTPDTMPHGDALRRLEERWLDTDAQTAQTIGADGTTIEDDEGSALDDMFWGNIWGYFWPVGALVWGFREEGVWTRRRKIAVFTGLMINLVFGFARLTSSR